MADAKKVTNESLLAEIKRLEAQNEALKKAVTNEKEISCKVSEKGAVSVYGLGRFPTTLYKSQWIRLIKSQDTIKAFINANADKLTDKTDQILKKATEKKEAEKEVQNDLFAGFN